MNCLIIRDFRTELVTLGTMHIGDGIAQLQTIERPWLDNTPRESCIPTGVYTCRRDFYNRGGYEAFEVIDVPGRTEIKIHIANYVKDIIGCIGVGMDRDEQFPAVWRSKEAFTKFMSLQEDAVEFRLEIIDG